MSSELVNEAGPPPALMSLSPRGGPRERREKKAQHERDAELNKLTVRARLAAVTARELTVHTHGDIPTAHR